MKFKANHVSKLINENNDLIMQFIVKSPHKYNANMAYQEIKQADNIVIEAKERKSTRSLDQNAMLWSLLGKLSEQTSGTKRKEVVEELYCSMLEEANIESDYMLALPETETTLKKSFRAIRKRGERDYQGKTMNIYQYWLGSSKFDTKQMTILIDLVLDKCAEFGVLDSEIEYIRSETK